MPIEEESKKVDKNSDDIQLLSQSLNTFYINIISKASAKCKFPSKVSEDKCSLDNLLCYLALREHDLSDLQLQLAEQGFSSLGSHNVMI